MTTPRKRVGRAHQRPAFSIRQLLLFFGLMAIALCAAGLLLKVMVRTADRHPGQVATIVVVVVLVAVSLRSVRNRRTARRRARARAVFPDQGEGTTVHEDVLASESTTEVETVLPRFEADEYVAMDPDTFEQAVAALCARDGCLDVQVVGGAGDLGADVTATTPDGRHLVIQCKRYGPVNKVGSQDVQRFGGTCFAVHDASVAAVVTTGEFTQPATEYAEQCGIQCFDHEALVAWTEGTGPAPWEAAPAAVPGGTA
ncbi:restriction endonuclease [Streptomyces sp. NPDC006551]|uniref:restriction endonuclease n=1 Tax=Streptomyces sp. NPDC006551 TaxID=3157178 RepID=UPI0033AF5874